LKVSSPQAGVRGGSPLLKVSSPQAGVRGRQPPFESDLAASGGEGAAAPKIEILFRQPAISTYSRPRNETEYAQSKMAAIHVDLPLYIRAPFNHSVNEQQKDKADLLHDTPSVFHATSEAAAGSAGTAGQAAGTAAADQKKIHLPLEMWEMILSTSHCVDTCQTHLVFKRQRFYNRDTYYTFSGTLREFQRAADILFVDYMHHSDKSQGDDLPWDSYCQGACQGHDECPMDRGAVCSSIWQIMEFKTKKELKLYETLIPSQYSYHGFYEVVNMQGGSYSGLSRGDTHESISGKPPSKGRERTCALARCGEVFYESDKHYFDDESQRHFCSNPCYTAAE